MNHRSKHIIYTSLFTTLTAVGALIKIPFPMVPMTLQTLFVLLSGNLIGARLGAFSQLLYLFIGLIGFPIFAYGGGPAYIFQPTFGYLLGYPVAAYVVGKLSEGVMKHHLKEGIFFKIFITNMLGILCIFTIGIIYLYSNLRFFAGQNIGFNKVMGFGFLIFLPGDLLKVICASWITDRVRTITMK